MKKILLTLFIVSFTLFTLSAQTWSNLGTGINMYVNTMAVYNGNLYVGGLFTRAGAIRAQGVAMWNGSTWSAVGGGTKGQYSSVNAMCVYNGKLYVGGQFDSAGITKANNIAMWDGSTWSAVGGGINGQYTSVYAMCVYNGNLYVGGDFDTAGGIPVHSLAKYNGTAWSDVGGGVTYYNPNIHPSTGTVGTMCVYNNSLCIGGYFDSAGNVPAESVASWNGSAWSNIGNAKSNGNLGYLFAMGVYNGDLFVAGNMDSINNYRNNGTAYWNGSAWTSAPYYFGATHCFYQWGTNFYLGSFAPDLYQWNGSRWDSIAYPITGDTVLVSAMCVYNGALYAGGQFHTIGGISADNIAKCSGSLGFEDVSDKNQTIPLYPNPNSGIFTIAFSHAKLVSASHPALEIFNMLGENIYSGKLNASTTQIDLSNNPSGIYLFRILTDTGSLVSSGKFVIQK